MEPFRPRAHPAEVAGLSPVPSCRQRRSALVGLRNHLGQSTQPAWCSLRCPGLFPEGTAAAVGSARGHPVLTPQLRPAGTVIAHGNHTRPKQTFKVNTLQLVTSIQPNNQRPSHLKADAGEVKVRQPAFIPPAASRVGYLLHCRSRKLTVAAEVQVPERAVGAQRCGKGRTASTFDDRAWRKQVLTALYHMTYHKTHMPGQPVLALNLQPRRDAGCHAAYCFGRLSSSTQQQLPVLTLQLHYTHSPQRPGAPRRGDAPELPPVLRRSRH